MWRCQPRQHLELLSAALAGKLLSKNLWENENVETSRCILKKSGTPLASRTST
ncbi:hypothetical protein IWX65_001007 [Arthrobacter sp. CAN_A214]